VTFHFDASDTAGTFILPVSAVINGIDGTFVFIAEPTDDDQAIVQRRPVSLGELTQLGIEVVDGVSIGDRVITAGISVIRDGQRVLLLANK
jgi:multidrug efflux pump subunit AcrA (membrane-fusion protein)